LCSQPLASCFRLPFFLLGLALFLVGLADCLGLTPFLIALAGCLDPAPFLLGLAGCLSRGPRLPQPKLLSVQCRWSKGVNELIDRALTRG